MNDYKFQKFIRRRTRMGKYAISLTSGNSFGLSADFCLKEDIRNYKSVNLYYDKDKNAVAFHFTNEDTDNDVFTLIHSKKGNSSFVTCKSFIVSNELYKKPENKGSKKPEKINYNNLILYVINLSPQT